MTDQSIMLDFKENLCQVSSL